MQTLGGVSYFWFFSGSITAHLSPLYKVLGYSAPPACQGHTQKSISRECVVAGFPFFILSSGFTVCGTQKLYSVWYIFALCQIVLQTIADIYFSVVLWRLWITVLEIILATVKNSMKNTRWINLIMHLLNKNLLYSYSITRY